MSRTGNSYFVYNYVIFLLSCKAMFALSFDGLLSREFHVYERVLSCKYVALPSFIA